MNTGPGCALGNTNVHLRRCMLLIFLALIGPAILYEMDAHPRASAHGSLQEDKLKDPQFIAEGSRIFAPLCGNAYCHGTGGIGGGAPRLRDKGLDAPHIFKTIANGIPGTGMLSFKSELSEVQMWKLVAFIMADAKTASATTESVDSAKRAPGSSTAPPKSATPAPPSPLVGDVVAGKSLFFDTGQTKSCHACHLFAGEGTPIGPDLTKLGTRSARQLFLDIVMTRESRDPRYSTITLTLKSGEKIRGIKKEEDGESIRVYDTTELPAVLRTVQKNDVVTVESREESIMPNDYASIYTMKQLLDLVTFLKSSESGSRVTLKDLVDRE